MGALLFFPALAHAHLMAADQATVNVVGDAVFCAISVPAEALHDVDDDHDGRLSSAEVALHRAAIRDEIARRFSVTDEGVAPQVVSLDLLLSPGHDEPPGGAANLIALLHGRFPRPPARLDVRSDLFASSRGVGLNVIVTAPGYKESYPLLPARSSHSFVIASGEAPRPRASAKRIAGWMAVALATLLVALRRNRTSEPLQDS